MKKYIHYFFAPLIFIITINRAFALGPPVITYTPATNVYTVNTAITTLTPNNTGGAVSANSLTTFSTDPGGGQPYGIAYDPTTGDIITDNYAAGAVYRYSPSGVLLNTYTTSIHTGGPKDIVVDNSGNIFVANGLGANIVKITPSGTTTTITATGTPFNQPDGMTIDRTTGIIYIADQGTNDVYSIASGATTATVYKSGFTNAYGVTVNSSTGVVYVSEYTPQADIKQIAAGGGAVTTFISKAAGGFTDLRNLDIDAAGDLFVANYGNNSIDEFSPTGVFIAHVVTGLNQPRATAEDVFGNLYIANSGDGDVEEYSTAFYSINIPLPAGMSFNTTTGQITGTPTVTSPTTVYTVVAHNASGSGYTTVTITVDPTGPTAPGGNICGTGTATLTATAGAPAGGTFNWYAASSGGAILASGATYTTPTLSVTTTYYVDYTQGGVTCAARTAVTVTVGANPIISTAPTSGAYFSYGFTAGSTSDIVGVNNGVTHGTPTTTFDRYTTTGNALNFVAASSQYISTTTSYTTPGPATFSISAWFKTSTAGGYIAGFGTSQTGNSISADRVIYVGTNGQLYFGMAPLGIKKTINTVTTYNDGSWHHVVATFSAANGSNMYVDGALAASDPTMNAAFALGGYWRVGYDAITSWTNAPATAAASYFNGALDDIAVANTELTPAQVNVLYGAGSSSTFCAGNALALTANTVAGATYSWVGPSGSGFTSALQNPTVPAANAIAGIYVLTVTGATGCTSVINVTAPSNVITYTWSGAAGTTNPLTAGNWDHLPLFTSITNLVIPTGLAKYPVLTANESIYGLTLASGATFSLGGFTLSMGCNIYNSSGGQILYGANNASGITWNGSLASQYYYGKNTANTAQVGTMIVNNSAAGTVNISGGPFDVYNLLTMTKGNLAVGATPAALTLKSSSTQTASVTAIPLGCGITGNVNVERYIQGSPASIQKRGYRLISSAVYTGASGGVNVVDFKYLMNNIYVTGLNGTGNGFNYTSPTNNPTLYLFREDSKPPPSKTIIFRTQYNWKGIARINNANAYDMTLPNRNNYTTNATDTTTTVPVGNGVLMYFRGDNSTANNGTTAGTKFSSPYNYPENATTTQVGKLNTGTVNVKLWFANAANGLNSTFSYTVGYASAGGYLKGGYACVGNPYASTINWEKYNRNGLASSIYGTVSTTIYVFNEANDQYEAYMPKTTISTVADTTTSINPGTVSSGATAASNMIASGQGFFVIATGTGQTLSFRETSKTNTQPASAGLGKLMGTSAPKEFALAPEPYMRMKLSSDSTHTDEIAIRMNNQSSTKFAFNEDALDLGGSGAAVSLSALSSDSVQLAIDYVPYPGKRPVVIPLMVLTTSSGTYKLENSKLDDLPLLYDAWLVDYFKNDSLKLKVNAAYTFTIDNTNPATFGNNRFAVVMRQNPAYAYQLLDFAASKVPNTLQVQTVWKTAYEQNYTRFTVERSIDGGKTFDVIGGFPGTGAGSYSLLDKSPVYGHNLYRLKQEDINDSISYSKVTDILYADLNNSNARVQLYPNPAKSTINVSILTDANAPCTIRVTNAAGFIVKQATNVQATWQTNVSDLLPGTYIVKVINGKDNSIVGDTKFVKL